MKCPRCETSTLDEKEREGVIVDVCGQCRGIWLDRGELEKIVSRATAEWDTSNRQAAHEYKERDHRKSQGEQHGGHPHGDVRHGKPYRKKNFFESLGDLFD